MVGHEPDRQTEPCRQARPGRRIAGGKVFVSSITAWEIAILVARGRIELAGEPQEWLATVGRIGPVEFVPVDNEIAVRSTKLGDIFHRDPADRFIVAT